MLDKTLSSSIGILTSMSPVLIRMTLDFFTVYTKLAEMALLASKYFTTVKKSYLGDQPDTRDYYWFRRPMPNQLS